MSQEIVKNNGVTKLCYLGKLWKSHLWRVWKTASIWDESMQRSVLKRLMLGVQPLELWLQHTDHSSHQGWIPRMDSSLGKAKGHGVIFILGHIVNLPFPPRSLSFLCLQAFSGAGLIYDDEEGILSTVKTRASHSFHCLCNKYLLTVSCGLAYQALGLGLVMQRKVRWISFPWDVHCLVEVRPTT